MRTSIGGISLFQIVILFVLLFTGIMCLTINHSKAFGVKDEIITIIQNEGLANANYELTDDTSEKIGEYLGEAGYRITGRCPSDEWIGYDRDGNKTGINNAAFCVKANSVTSAFYGDAKDKCKEITKDPTKCVVASGGDYPSMVYYDIVLFYQLQIPVINNIINFRVYGSTKVLINGSI